MGTQIIATITNIETNINFILNILILIYFTNLFLNEYRVITK